MRRYVDRQDDCIPPRGNGECVWRGFYIRNPLARRDPPLARSFGIPVCGSINLFGFLSLVYVMCMVSNPGTSAI